MHAYRKCNDDEISNIVNEGDRVIHGNYEMYVVGKVLVSKSFGSWNEFTVKEFFEQYIEMSAPLINAPWGGLVDVSQWQLATPDAEKLAVIFEQWCIENNRHFVAIVGSSAITDFQLKRSGIKDKTDIVDVRHFESFDEAIDWFIKLGLWK
ncbi:MAG: hypothetical protein HRU25_10500 [Psychrobium sp.]|nr:hypothetical protein [Psychrobium sp.]